MEDRIRGGAFQIARRIFNSWIWAKPPYYLKLWVWLIGKCNHQKINRLGNTFQRGECLVTLEETRKQTEYLAGWRTEKISKSQAWNFYEDCRKQSMIDTRKTTRGMFVKVLNYNKYQTLDNYEYNNEKIRKTTRRQQTPNTINKNDKERKERKNISTVKDECKKILGIFNKIQDREGSYILTSFKGWKSNWEYWREDYSLEDVRLAVKNSLTDSYWRDKLTPTILFRQRNSGQEPTDRIEMLKNRNGGTKQSIKDRIIK